MEIYIICCVPAQIKNELMKWADFCIVLQIQESKKLFQWFMGGQVKNGHGYLVHEILKSAE